MATRRNTRSSTSTEITLQEDIDSNTSLPGNQSSSGNMANVANCANNHTNIIEYSYELNRDKAMANKILSASRKDYEYEITGGGHRIRFNTGTYEHVKYSLPHYYRNHKDFYSEERFHVEKSKSVVDVMMAIHNRKDNTKSFVINLYNTTSLALVNGKSPAIFKTHLEELMGNISRDDVDNINTMLDGIRRSQRFKKPSAKLQESANQDNKSSSNKDKKQTKRHVPAHRLTELPSLPDSTDTSQELILSEITTDSDTIITSDDSVTPASTVILANNQSTESLTVRPKTNQRPNHTVPAIPTDLVDNDDKTACPTCKRKAGKHAVKCDTCSLKIHYKCEGLQPDEIKQITETNYAYKCTSCSTLTEATPVDTPVDTPIEDVETSLPTLAQTPTGQDNTNTRGNQHHSPPKDTNTQQVVISQQTQVNTPHETVVEKTNTDPKATTNNQTVAKQQTQRVNLPNPATKTQAKNHRKNTKANNESVDAELIEQNTLLKNLNNKYVDRINTLTEENRRLRLQLLAFDTE